MAGVPKIVIQQARDKLQLLEGESVELKSSAPEAVTVPVSELKASPMQSDLFAQAPSAVELAIAEILVDDLTPRQALDEIYRLKSMLS